MKKFTNSDSTIKQQVRERIYEEFRNNVPPLNVGCAITLPNTNFWLEKMIYISYPRTIVKSYEKNMDIFYNTLYPEWMNILPHDIFKHDNNLDVNFLYLDLCCSFNPESLSKIAEFMQKTRFCTNSTIAITLCHQHSRTQEYPKNIKEEGFFKYVIPFIDRTPDNCKILTYSCWDISPKANTMSTFILNFN